MSKFTGEGCSVDTLNLEEPRWDKAAALGKLRTSTRRQLLVPAAFWVWPCGSLHGDPVPGSVTEIIAQ